MYTLNATISGDYTCDRVSAVFGSTSVDLCVANERLTRLYTEVCTRLGNLNRVYHVPTCKARYRGSPSACSGHWRPLVRSGMLTVQLTPSPKYTLYPLQSLASGGYIRERGTQFLRYRKFRGTPLEPCQRMLSRDHASICGCHF